jgi:hypothetical protein
VQSGEQLSLPPPQPASIRTATINNTGSASQYRILEPFISILPFVFLDTLSSASGTLPSAFVAQTCCCQTIEQWPTNALPELLKLNLNHEAIPSSFGYQAP